MNRAVLIAGFGVALGLCSWLSPSTARAQGHLPRPESLKIGLLVPLTGKRARLGEAALDVATMAKLETGGPEIVIADSEGTVSGARAQMERLAADLDVVAVLGPVGWNVSQAAAQVAQTRQVPMVSLTSQEGIERHGSFVFRGRVSVEEQSRLVARVAVEELNVESFAILHPDDVLGERSSRAFFEEVRRLGGRVTSLATYEAGETNLARGVEELVGKRMPRLAGRGLRAAPRARRRLAAQNPTIDFGAVFVPDYDEGVALAAKFMRFHDVPLAGLGDGSSLLVLGTSQLPGPRLADAEGLLAGALYPESFRAGQGTEMAQAFVVRFRDAHERDPEPFDAKVYDLYVLLSQAIAACETKAGEPLRARQFFPTALAEIEPYYGLGGLQWFEADGRPGHQMNIWVVDAAGGVSPSY